MIDNEFYKELGEKWFTSQGDAIALLRCENAAKLPWVVDEIGPEPRAVLDVGCGGGFLSLELSQRGHAVTALDVAQSILDVGRAREPRVHWVEGRAERLPFADASFDVVCVMDVLEHVDAADVALSEAKRVLRPGGKLLLHTFNRTWRSWFFASKGLDWFIKDSPKHIHEWRRFIRLDEMQAFLSEMTEVKFTGLHPVIWSRAFWRLAWTGRVDEGFRFRRGGGLGLGYLVTALKPLQSAASV